jgi:predicted transcriptional regulator
LKKPYARPAISRMGEDFEEIPIRLHDITNTHLNGERHLDPIIAIAADLVSSYVSNNSLPAAELPEFISTIYASIKAVSLGVSDVRPDEVKAAVAVRKSVTADFIICLEDGKRFKSLKRHIGTQYGLTPDQYRAKWKLPSNYPMVAPNYSATRSRMAKSMGLGRKPK